MRRLNPGYVEGIRSATNGCPYFSLLSMKIVDLELSRSLLEIDLGQKHLQPFGQVHGGVFSSIVDAAAWWAVFTEADEDMGMTTVELKLNYLAPASGRGKMIARGRSIKLGRTLGLGDAEIIDEEGKLLAHGTSTMMVIPKLGLGNFAGLPPKFVNEGD